MKNENGQAGDTYWGKTSRLLCPERSSAAWRAGGVLRAFHFAHMVPMRAVGFLTARSDSNVRRAVECTYFCF